MRHNQIKANLCSNEWTAATLVRMADTTTSAITPTTMQQHPMPLPTPHPLWKSSLPLSPKTPRRQSATSTSTVQILPVSMLISRLPHRQTLQSTSPISAPMARLARTASALASTLRRRWQQLQPVRRTANSSQIAPIPPVHSDIPALRPVGTVLIVLSRVAHTPTVRFYVDSIRA